MDSIKQAGIRFVNAAGLPVLEPVIRLLFGEEPRKQLGLMWLFLGVPLLAFGVFLAVWTGAAAHVHTKYGALPNPAAVWRQAGNLLADHQRSRAEEAQFYTANLALAARFEAAATVMRERAEAAQAGDRGELLAKFEKLESRAHDAKTRRFSASPTYVDQIVTSLKTVFAGFLIASAIAVPLGILCGLSPVFLAAMNPLIQLFKPVSPLAWLPIVMIVVGAVYTTAPDQAWFEKSFISSAFTVALCSLWPTLTNTALGVASIEQDHINVARVLKLGWWTRVRRIVLPSALPLMFTGLRISLGVGWMVLIAAEMLAQNPGLGKFVWDMFQNGSSQTLAQIMVAVLTIGVIGFMLDRVMIVLQRSVSYDTAVGA